VQSVEQKDIVPQSAEASRLAQHENTAESFQDEILPGKKQSVDGRPASILFAVDSRFPGLGGAESQALKLAIALREQGVHVEFVSPHIIKTRALTDTFEGFAVTRIPYPQIRWLGSIVLMMRFYRYLISNSHRFDAVHIHITHLMAAAAGFARKRSGLRVITKISGFYEFEGGVLDLSARFKPLNFLIRTGLKKVDYVQTISAQTREKLLQSGFLNRQIQFVPNGIDTRHVPSAPPSRETIRIGYCGRLREVKGVHVLLEGIAMLNTLQPDTAFHLLVAGDGDALPGLKEQAHTLGLDDNVEWLGLIDDTVSFFKSIHLYVQPSFAEGLPNSVMEAMVEQRAVVASDIGGNNDLITDQENGLLFPAGDASALATQLSRLVENSEFADELALQGRQSILERFGFEAITSKLVRLYCE